MSRRQHAGSLMLPITVLIIIPSLIFFSRKDITWASILSPTSSMLILASGLLLISIGLFALAETAHLFASVGHGTLAPWAPTQSLVVQGMYRYVRNPMVLGVLLVLVGETLVFSSIMLLVWSGVFFVGNHIYFIRSEEPGLVKRFGEEYVIYRENVPRWLPRRTPWTGRSEH